MTKKKIRNFGGKFFENRGESETGRKCIMASGGDGRPRIFGSVTETFSA